MVGMVAAMKGFNGKQGTELADVIVNKIKEAVDKVDASYHKMTARADLLRRLAGAGAPSVLPASTANPWKERPRLLAAFPSIACDAGRLAPNASLAQL